MERNESIKIVNKYGSIKVLEVIESSNLEKPIYSFLTRARIKNLLRISESNHSFAYEISLVLLLLIENF